MYRNEEPEINLEQVLRRARSFLGRFRGGGGGVGAYLVVGFFAVALAIWMGTGFYTVQPGEMAALRRFGKFVGTQEPGLHWFWPAPIGTRDVVAVDAVRKIEVGVRGNTPVFSESLMITGDENIVDVQLLVQFNIKRDELDKFLFRVVDPAGQTIKDATESALREVVGRRTIDDVLTVEKGQIQDEIKALLQQLLDNYETGIRVREVKLLNVRPPAQVQDAFDDVVRAKEDKARIINLAEAYREDVIPKARGEAARMLEEARAFKAQRIAQATGQAQRFLTILEEYKKAPDVTRQRLYLEAMEEVLPGITKFIVDPAAGGGLLQFLPLQKASPSSPSGP